MGVTISMYEDSDARQDCMKSLLSWWSGTDGTQWSEFHLSCFLIPYSLFLDMEISFTHAIKWNKMQSVLQFFLEQILCN